MHRLSSDIGNWFPYNTDPGEYRIFCFPYAGASASTYRSWLPKFDPRIRLWPLQLPARETRFADPAVTDLDQLLDMIIHAAMPLFFDGKFAFFGHSFGARLGFELARRLVLKNLPTPQSLFISGRSAPLIEPRTKGLYLKPDHAFLETVRQYGGIPAALAHNVDLLACCTPVLRMDFELDETPFTDHAPLACPIYGFFGEQDPLVSSEERNAWAQLTTSEFKWHMFQGDHFFYHAHLDRITDLMQEEIFHQGALPNISFSTGERRNEYLLSQTS